MDDLLSRVSAGRDENRTGTAGGSPIVIYSASARKREMKLQEVTFGFSVSGAHV